MSLRERFADVARFVMRPSLVPRQMAWRPEFVRTWALLVIFTLSAVLVSSLLINTLLGSVGVLPESTRELPGLRNLLEYLVIAPLLEEMLCRGWMSGRRASLRFAAFGAVALGLLLSVFLVEVDIRKALAFVAAAAAFAGLIQWSLTRYRDRDIPAWFVRHFRWAVWGSSMVFALLHLGRYEVLSHPLGVLVVAPLMLGGILLAYTRTRLGLRAAILHHAAYNSVLVGLVAITGP